MIISEIYKKYKIIPNLQEHMQRVAGVAKTVAENLEERVDISLIISSALLHDIGNMAKFKLEAFPGLIKSEEKEYWEKVVGDFKQKYGDNDYSATYKILKELEVSQEIYDLIDSLEFAKAAQTKDSTNKESKICLYSDARVSPQGVVSLKDRLSEVKERYMRNKGISEETYSKISESLYKIEEQIFAKCKIKPEDITEEKVKPLMETLLNYDIKLKTANV